MSNLEIGYDEHEGKRRRHWWNKMFGLFLIAPIGSAVLALALSVVAFATSYPDGPPSRSEKAQLEKLQIGVAGFSFLVGLPLVYNGWMSIMKDDG